jgi:hypothetical protein
MASMQHVRGLTLPRTSGRGPGNLRIEAPFLWSAFVTLLIAGPWLAPGYLFGTDWPGPRRFDFPSVLSNSAPLEAVLAAVSRITSGEFTGKLFVVAMLFAAALMAFRAAPVDGFVPRAVASTVYVFNPFVFGRLHYGQIFLLAGYALLPWVVLELRRVLVTPSHTGSLTLGASMVVIGVFSTHMFLVAVLVAWVLAASHIVAAAETLEYTKRIGSRLLVAAVVTFAVSSYWAVPLLIGRGPIAAATAGFGPADLTAFAVVPDSHLGLLTNVLGLYGFWAENTGRFASMKGFVPFWPVVLALLLAISAVGAGWTFRQRRDLLGTWVAGLLFSAAAALILEMGVSTPLTRGLVTWLDTSFPVYRGMRDAGKWAALLALVYSQLSAVGTAAILGWIRTRPRVGPRTGWLGAVAAGSLLALPLYYGNGLLYGMHGEIVPSHYPQGWYSADRALAADPHAGRTLFLPWHEYMAYSFIRNQNKVVAPPAPSFFSTPMLVSANPEVFGIAPPTDPDQTAIAQLVQEAGQGLWGQVLADHGIKYVLLAREVDWETYRYLDQRADLLKVGDYGSIILYRNSLAT